MPAADSDQQQSASTSLRTTAEQLQQVRSRVDVTLFLRPRESFQPLAGSFPSPSAEQPGSCSVGWPQRSPRPLVPTACGSRLQAVQPQLQSSSQKNEGTLQLWPAVRSEAAHAVQEEPAKSRQLEIRYAPCRRRQLPL